MPANIEPTQISFPKRNFRIGKEKRKCQKKFNTTWNISFGLKNKHHKKA